MDTLEHIVATLGGVFRTADALRVGISRTTIANYAKGGRIDRIAHGVYAAKDALVDELYVLQLRSPRIIFSHETALWLNGLSDRDPFSISITLPNCAPLGEKLRQTCVCHYVKRPLLDLGLETRKTIYGNGVRCYNAERTVCDMVRSERRTGTEAFYGGIKQYAASKTKNIAELMKIASAFGIEEEIAKYMGVLL